MKSESIKGIIVLVALCVIGVGGKLHKNYIDRKIYKHAKVTIAHIVSVEPYNKPTPTRIYYYYIVDRDTFYFDYTPESIINFNKLKSLEGKMLPVIYDSTSIKDNKLVIDEDRYK